MKRAVALLVFVASAAHGEIYTWKDSRGTAHYTNSIYEIPARYRSGMKVLDLGTEQKTDAAAPQQSAPSRPVTVRPEAPRQQRNEPKPERHRSRGRKASLPEEE